MQAGQELVAGSAGSHKPFLKPEEIPPHRSSSRQLVQNEMEWSSSSSSQTGTDRYCGCSFELHSPRLARCDAAHTRVHYMCDV